MEPMAIIVGSSKRSRRALRDALHGECRRVIEACDNAEAFELSRRYVPDVIVVSGEQPPEKIGRDRELAAVPVVCLAKPDDLPARVRAALHRA